MVIPMLYARDGDRLLLHGSPHSRLIHTAGTGVQVCVTVTHLDGLVLARSAFRHAANYRSVVVFGAARAIEDLTERGAAVDRFVDGLVPGRSTEAFPPRPPSEPELKATMVLALPLDEMSVKQRSGGPQEELQDYTHAAWAGVVPLAVTAGEPIPDPRLLTDPPAEGMPPVPACALKYPHL